MRVPSSAPSAARRRPSLAVRSRAAALVVTLALAAGCGSGGGMKQYGDFNALHPSLTVPPKEHPPTAATVALGTPGYAALFYVVPGVGASLVYPTDSLTANRLDAGQHTVALAFPKAVMNRDSLLAARRGGRTPGGRQMPVGRRDSAQAGTGPIPTPSPLTVPFGYLLLVTSPDQLSYALLKRHVEGITIPAEDDEALSTVIKLVRGTLPERTTWAGTSREVELR